MKRTKKLLAVLLSLLMVFSVCTVAFAADGGVTVTFLDSDGTTLAAAQTIAAGAVPEIPADPVKEDCFFRGWKLPDEYKYYDFKTPLDEDTALTAIFEEGVGFYREDFQAITETQFSTQAVGWALTAEDGNCFARHPGGTAAGPFKTPVFDMSSVSDQSYLYIDFRYRNPATEDETTALDGIDGHSEMTVKYRFANTDAEDAWRTDSIYTDTDDAHDGWTNTHAMMFFYPQYFSYEDIQFAFVVDGSEGVFDLDDICIYCGGHDFEYDFAYDDEAGAYIENEIFVICENDGCTLGPDFEARVRINAPEKKYADDDKSPDATLTGLDAFNFYTNVGMRDEIIYVSVDDESTDLPGAPTEPGIYAACLDIYEYDLGIELSTWLVVQYAIGYTLTYGQTLTAITLPSANYSWADGVDTSAVLPVGEYEFDVDLTITYEYEDWTTGDLVTETYVDTFPMPVRVVPKEITVTAKAAEKTEGETDPALEYTVAGLVGTDQLTGALARETGEAAGTYAIGQGTLSAGDNYTIKFTGATFTIKAKQTPPEEPTNPPEEPTTNPPAEEPTTNPPADPENKGSCCDTFKRFFCELKDMLVQFFSYPFRLLIKMFSEFKAEC